MRLISRVLFEQQFGAEGKLRIEPLAPENFGPTFYYFRLGALAHAGAVIPIDGQLVIKPRDVATVWSQEAFSLGFDVLGILGGLSSQHRTALELVNAVAIDPGFDGCLEVGLRNNASRDATVRVGEAIGKILFFDVSDTPIDAGEQAPSILRARLLRDRDRARRRMARVLGRSGSEEHEVIFGDALLLGEDAADRLEEYAEHRSGAREAEALRDAGAPDLVAGVRLAGLGTPPSATMAQDIEDFAVSLVGSGGSDGLGFQ